LQASFFRHPESTLYLWPIIRDPREGGDVRHLQIDYYAPDMQHGSEDASDPKQTVRVLTIMLASEY
jgi:hypothetical protein